MTRSPRSISLLLIACLFSHACAAFENPTRGVCGNRIVEEGEDCDDPDDDACGPANLASACRILCEPGGGEEDDEDEDTETADAVEDSAAAGCSDGRLCGNDGICRAPAGTFTDAPIVIDEAGARRIAVGDLDGDARDDLILALSEPEGMDVKAIYIDPPGEVTRVDLVDPINALIAVGDLTRDGLDDVLIVPESGPAVASASPVSLWQGTADRTTQVSVFATLRAEGSGARLLAPTPELDRVLELVDPMTTRRWSSDAVAAVDAAPAGVDPTTLGRAVAAAALDPDEAACDGGPTLASFPRPTVALALAGATEVRLATTCGDDDGLTPRGAVLLPDGATLGDAGALLERVNDDDALDLIVQADDGAVLVAFGVGDGSFHSEPVLPTTGDGRFAATPWLPALADDAGTLLSAADFDDDGALELVTTRALFPAPETCGAPCPRVPWSRELADAVAVDLNNDGALDVAGLTDDLVVIHLNGALGPFPFAARTLERNGEVREPVVGDFNHDTVPDLAFAELYEDELPSAADEVVQVLYGGADVDAWRLESFGPFIAIERLVVEQSSRLVARVRDEPGRPAGAFITPGAVSHDFGLALRGPVVVDTGELAVASLVALPGQDASLLGHLGFHGGALSPHDITVGDDLDMSVATGIHTLAAAIDVDGDGRDELLLLGTRDGGGAAWLARLDDAGAWRLADSFAVGPGFAARPVDAVGLAASSPPPGGGPGSTLVVCDVDGDGLLDALATTDEPTPRVALLRNDDGALTADATELLTGDPDFQYALLAPWHPTPAGDLRLLVGGADGVGLATIDLDAGALPTTRLLEAPAEALAVADVDGDGLLDLVLGTAEELFVHLADERVGG